MKRKAGVWMAALALTMAAGAYEIPEEARYPYVATAYVQPVVTPTNETKVGFFVTDWDNSKVRFGDDSHVFSARLRYTTNGVDWTELATNGLHSGDHVFTLGRLPAGDYRFGITATDAAGRPSHTVWHEFRSREAHEIPEAKTWRVTEAELADYGLVPETNRYSFHLVDASQDALTNKTNSVAMVKAEMEAAAAAFAPESGTYAIFAPAKEGRLLYKSWKQSAVAYSDDYDFEAVEAEAATNVVALQRLFDEAVEKGFEKLVLPRNAYRVSGLSFVTVPSRLTVDLNGSTVKMNSFTGSSGKIFVLTHAHDAHLVNGTLEGDYFEHDYEGSPNGSEWVLGVSLEGDCRYSSLEDLKVWRITGYGVSNGTRAYDHTFGSVIAMTGNAKSPYVAGVLDLADGRVGTSVTNRFTSDYRDISKLTNGYLSVSKYLGYQGIRTKSWYYTAAFYDSDKNYLGGEVAFQYRLIPIPAGAKYLRITVDTATREDADACDMSAQHFKMPWNCAFKRLHIELCRAVGMAQSAMRNMLVEDCDFSYSGDTLATCAYDAEDGWDSMQDVYIHRNVFHDNPMNEFLTCAGHNFIVEDNVANLHFYARCNSPCVRNNTAKTATFCCDGSRNRTMHGRYENNRYGTTLDIGRSSVDIGWDICIHEDLASYIDGQQLSVNPSRTGRIRDCTLTHAKLFNTACSFDNLVFTNVNLVETMGFNTFTNCLFESCYLQHFNISNTFADCVLLDTSLSGMSGGTMILDRCALTNVTFSTGYWSKPDSFEISHCDVRGADSFLSIAVYSIGRIRAHDTTFDTGASPVFKIFDLRKNASQQPFYEPLPGVMAFWNCRFLSPPVTATGGSNESRKPIRFFNRDNELPDGVDFLAPGKAKDVCPWEFVTDRDPETETLSTEIPVPLAWLAKCPALLKRVDGNFESAAALTTGKTSHDGHEIAAWEEYVQGTDPDDPDSRFTAFIEMDEGGNPVVTWDPDLGSARTYETLGSTDLSDWHAARAGDTFFTVRVQIKAEDLGFSACK